MYFFITFQKFYCEILRSGTKKDKICTWLDFILFFWRFTTVKTRQTELFKTEDVDILKELSLEELKVVYMGHF